MSKKEADQDLKTIKSTLDHLFPEEEHDLNSLKSSLQNFSNAEQESSKISTEFQDDPYYKSMLQTIVKNTPENKLTEYWPELMKSGYDDEKTRAI